MINGHLIPFFWVRTENEEELKRGIDEIYNYGITSFCVESRPFYPERVQRGKPESDFNGEEWFKRAETILDYAREKGMKVWFFDDKGFPSGIAAGKYAERRDLLPSQLICNFIDFASDGNVITLLTPVKEEDDTLLALVVTKYKDGTADFSDYTEIPIAANARTTSFKIPEGVYRAAFLMRSKRFGEFPIYMDVLSDESTDFYIQELYEKHYLRLKRFYGETFCGFFSDEPRFGNGYFNYELAGRPNVFGNVLGLPGGAYPVSDETLSLLGKSGYKIAELVGLYTDIGEKTSDLRVCYADIATDIYKRNYSSKIGKWCKNHGVTYAAHIIEDLGGHCRFGCGAGHYFKAMDGLDYAGVDVVLQSLKPYFTKGKIISATGFCDADFYVHVLGKLASSSAALDENKQGRALCEIFGAYGFCETIKDMVYLVNLFIVSGINYFIPHAFTMDYPDEDCPPHFYVGKRVLSYKGYKLLFEYTEKLCGLFSGGKRKTSVAVLYNAEAEWSGKCFTSINEVAKILNEATIDFDFVPSYKLKKASGKYGVLIVPFSEHKAECVEKEIEESGMAVLREREDFTLCGLARTLYSKGYVKKRVECDSADLRVYEYYKDEKEIFALFNSGIRKINGRVYTGKDCVACDYLNDKKFAAPEQNGWCSFSLAPGELSILTEGDAFETEKYEKCGEITDFTIEKREYGAADFSAYNGFDENFSGELRYSFKIEPRADKIKAYYYGEFCELNVGDKTFVSIGDGEFTGKMEGNAEVTVANTLANELKDRFSHYGALRSCGLEKVVLYKKGENSND